MLTQCSVLCVWLSAVPHGLIAQRDGGGTAQLCSVPSAVALQAAVCISVVMSCGSSAPVMESP